MKVVASSLIAAALTVANVHADVCDSASVTVLLTSGEVAACTSSSGYSPSSLRSPAIAQLEIMCSAKACQTMLSIVTTMFPEECTINTFALHSGLLAPVSTYCGGSSNSSSLTVTPTDTDLLASTSTTASTETEGATSESSLTDAMMSSALFDNADQKTTGSLDGSVSSTDYADQMTTGSLDGSVSLTNLNESMAWDDYNGSMAWDNYNDSTASAIFDDDMMMDVSGSGSEFTIETMPPSTSSDSLSPDDEGSVSGDPDAVDETPDRASGSVTVGPSSAMLLGSAVVATAALFL
uniref:Elicitin-like protein n=1 Tax=Hyaloperonospora arabidopsidis (strain Emoy2) TaxID=559515 RepID=M4C1Q0_HYAAE